MLGINTSLCLSLVIILIALLKEAFTFLQDTKVNALQRELKDTKNEMLKLRKANLTGDHMEPESSKSLEKHYKDKVNKSYELRTDIFMPDGYDRRHMVVIVLMLYDTSIAMHLCSWLQRNRSGHEQLWLTNDYHELIVKKLWSGD